MITLPRYGRNSFYDKLLIMSRVFITKSLIKENCSLSSLNIIYSHFHTAACMSYALGLMGIISIY